MVARFGIAKANSIDLFFRFPFYEKAKGDLYVEIRRSV